MAGCRETFEMKTQFKTRCYFFLPDYYSLINGVGLYRAFPLTLVTLYSKKPLQTLRARWSKCLVQGHMTLQPFLVRSPKTFYISTYAS